MTPTDLSRVLATCLEGAVPDADASTLDPSANLRDQLDVDSMDMLRFLRGVAEATGIDIPETDARKFETLDSAAAYLRERLSITG